jgi:hypothetical protein
MSRENANDQFNAMSVKQLQQYLINHGVTVSGHFLRRPFCVQMLYQPNVVGLLLLSNPRRISEGEFETRLTGLRRFLSSRLAFKKFCIAEIFYSYIQFFFPIIFYFFTGGDNRIWIFSCWSIALNKM